MSVPVVPPAGASAAGLLMIAEAGLAACGSAHWRRILSLALANFE